MITRLRIAKLDAGSLPLSKRGLNSQHTFGFCLSFFSWVARKLEDLGHVGEIRGANFLIAFARSKIVVTVGQGSTTLEGLCYFLGGVFLFLPYTEVKKSGVGVFRLESS